jgi:hypothetical protein
VQRRGSLDLTVENGKLNYHSQDENTDRPGLLLSPFYFLTTKSECKKFLMKVSYKK